MLIAGLVKSTLIDYPGKVSAVIFTQGCNFRCGFCHNPDLIPSSEDSNNKSQISEGEVLDFLEKRVGKLDGVVITGGEPTLQPDLVDFTKKIKALGYCVKLDTNGSAPAILKSLITSHLVDYVAMDIKNSPDRYQETCGYPYSQQIQDSIKLIMDSGVDYEFRTTVLPPYHDDKSMEDLAKQIKGAKKYVIQNFRSEIVYDSKLKNAKSFAEKDLERFKKIAKKYISEVQIRKNI